MPTLEPELAKVVPIRNYDLPDRSDRGDRHHVSHTELSTFRDCPLKWLLKYYWGLQPPERQVRLDRGSPWHHVLEVHYDCIQAGKGPAETREIILMKMSEWEHANVVMSREEWATILWMYDDYVQIYKSDHDYEIVQTEAPFEFPMPVEGAPELIIVGKIDLETIDRGGKHEGARRVWDHKSASQRDVSKDGFLSEMLMDDQFPLYAEAKRRGGEPVESVIYSVSRTDKLKRVMLYSERFYRKSIPYPAPALEAVWADYERTAAALVRVWNDPELVYSVPNPKQCGWKCEFQRAHLDSRATGRPIVQVAIDYGHRFKDRGQGELEAPVDESGSGW